MYSSVRFSRWRQRLSSPRGWVPVVGAAATVVLTLAGVAVAGVLPGLGSLPAPGGQRPASTHHGTRPGGAGQPGTPGGQSSGQGPGGGSGSGSQGGKAGPAGGHRPGHTFCRQVAHIGDSTSVGMVSAAVLPHRSQRLAARYARVGVRSSLVDASGGRSVVEAMPGQVNGYGVAAHWDAHRYHGCWVIALGTNDTANVAAGSAISRPARITMMMAAAHGQPVMWVNVKTLAPGGPWSEHNMRLWNAALRRACVRYPNMRVYDWAAAARDGWFIPDGIHYTPAGYAHRARLIARALAAAFPAGGHSTGCAVR
jgi:GDSL-like lipase/acylhydrolase family protein